MLPLSPSPSSPQNARPNNNTWPANQKWDHLEKMAWTPPLPLSSPPSFPSVLTPLSSSTSSWKGWMKGMAVAATNWLMAPAG